MKINPDSNLTADGWLPPISIVQEVYNRAKMNDLYSNKWGDRLLNVWSDFFNLPITYKEDLRGIPAEANLAVPKSEVWHYHESFGTTGAPVSSWFTAEDFEVEVNKTYRWTSEIKPGMMLLNRFPYSFAVPPFILEQKCRRDGGIIVPIGSLSWNISYQRTLEVIKRLKIEAIACLPNELIFLELIAEKCGYDIKNDFGSVSHVLVSGTIITPAMKEYIEESWGVSVKSVYGTTETGGIASTCSLGNLHIHKGDMILELIDPVSKEPVISGGTGVLVVTSYSRKASPLFRYYTNDSCRIVSEPCSCGDTQPIIQVLGRMDDLITLNGINIFPNFLEQSILEFAKQFNSVVYFVVVTKNKLHIRIETHNNSRKPTDSSLTELCRKLIVPIKVHICKKGALIDTDFLLRSPEVYKPVSIADWRTKSTRSITITEALIRWKVIGLNEFSTIVWRIFKNAVLKQIFNA